MKTNYIRMKIGQLGILSRGVTYSPPEDLRSESDSTSIWLLRSTNLQGGEINLDDVTIVAAHCAKPNQRLANGDIAICTANGSKALVGKASLVCLPNPSQYVVGAFCARMRPNDGESPEFLAALFESGFYKSWIGRLLAGTNINNLKPSDIASCSIRMPSSLAQRNRLGEIFSLSRLQIKTLDRLIAAKREQKRGLMQQLLTGKLRFPGFTEPWKTVRLGELGNLNRGVTYSGDRDVRNADSIDTVRLLRATNIQGGKLNLDDVTIIDFRRGNLAALLKPGDFVICIANGSKRLVGKNALIGNELSNRPHVVGAFCARFQPADGVAPTFMAAVMESPSYQKWIGILLAGTSINNLKPSDIALIPFHLPTTSAEQRKIGAIWNVLETEIELLEQQRAAFAAQRRGLMEKLLSGEIDIQNPKETAA